MAGWRDGGMAYLDATRKVAVHRIALDQGVVVGVVHEALNNSTHTRKYMSGRVVMNKRERACGVWRVACGVWRTIGFQLSGCTPSEAADFSFSLSESNEIVPSTPGVWGASTGAAVAVLLRSARSFWSWATCEGTPEGGARRMDMASCVLTSLAFWWLIVWGALQMYKSLQNGTGRTDSTAVLPSQNPYFAGSASSGRLSGAFNICRITLRAKTVVSTADRISRPSSVAKVATTASLP